ncbi:hypothetical protein GALL_548420 [mine drainage metagenome]|uniref:Uncharacterized protein n=1 Tax=mine drainage metagenome TaxID=410659 RepID=A0A1J5NWL8_9ZZZZ
MQLVQRQRHVPVSSRQRLCTVIQAIQLGVSGTLGEKGFHPFDKRFGADRELRYRVIDPASPARERIDGFGALLGAPGQFPGTQSQLEHSFMQSLHAALRPCGIREHQRPALFIEALIDFAPEIFGETPSQSGAGITVALRGVNHQLASASLCTRNRVRAEISRNNQSKRQQPLAHLLTCLLFVGNIKVTKIWPGLELGGDFPADVKRLLPVLQSPVQIDNGHRQGTGMGGRVPDAGQIKNHVERRNQHHHRSRQQQPGRSRKKSGLQPGNRKHRSKK